MTTILLRLRAALAAWEVILLSIVCLVIYYEGIGPIRDLRYVGTVITYVPLIGDLVEGRVAKAERAARVDGAAAEKSAWEELRRRAEIAAQQARAKAQAKVDAAEAARLATERDHVEQLDDLNDIIDQERTGHAPADKASSDSPSCAPMPRRVLDGLNAIGRR
jgi:hypothetical protein